MRIRSAFTMIELIFVIVVMGIIGKFGVEFLAQAYKSFIFSNINNTLQSNSASAVEIISSRLQYRIKDSVIARIGQAGTPKAIGSASGTDYTVLEWIATDIEGYRGTTTPHWSGIADLDAGSASLVRSPETNSSQVDAHIGTMSYGTKGINNAAIYFVGSDSDITNGYGWNGALTNQNGTMHPIMSTGTLTDLVPRIGGTTTANTFLTGVDVYEYYKLAWTAYAIEFGDVDDLILHYNYQPWDGDSIANGDSNTTLLVQDVDTFQFMSIGSIMKIQVCAKSDLVEEYSLCKEKTIF